MKKVLKLILAMLGLLLLAFLVLLEVNAIHPFITIPANYLTIVTYVVKFGAMAVLAAWVLIYFAGKGVLRVLLTIITVLVIALGVIAFGFPELITKVLG